MYPKTRNDNIVVQELEGEVLIYDLKTNKANCLNKTAAAVWKLCDGKRNIQQIAEKVSRDFKKPILEELIYLSIQQLKDSNLLTNSEHIKDKFNGSTRRELIKKVGMASMIALPIISSIAVPKAADAQSNICTRNVCFAAGENYCAGCVGQTISITGFFSNDGSCTGFSFTQNFNCVGSASSSDTRRN